MPSQSGAPLGAPRTGRMGVRGHRRQCGSVQTNTREPSSRIPRDVAPEGRRPASGRHRERRSCGPHATRRRRVRSRCPPARGSRDTKNARDPSGDRNTAPTRPRGSSGPTSFVPSRQGGLRRRTRRGPGVVGVLGHEWLAVSKSTTGVPRRLRSRRRTDSVNEDGRPAPRIACRAAADSRRSAQRAGRQRAEVSPVAKRSRGPSVSAGRACRTREEHSRAVVRHPVEVSEVRPPRGRRTESRLAVEAFVEVVLRVGVAATSRSVVRKKPAPRPARSPRSPPRNPPPGPSPGPVDISRDSGIGPFVDVLADRRGAIAGIGRA